MINIIHNAYIEIIAGIARIHSDGEVITEDRRGNSITIAFPDLNPRKALIRRYHDNGEKYREQEYYEGHRHGLDIGWSKNGTKRWEESYCQGELHGKCLIHNSNGEIAWASEYNHGELIDENTIT